MFSSKHFFLLLAFFNQLLCQTSQNNVLIYGSHWQEGDGAVEYKNSNDSISAFTVFVKKNETFGLKVDVKLYFEFLEIANGEAFLYYQITNESFSATLQYKGIGVVCDGSHKKEGIQKFERKTPSDLNQYDHVFVLKLEMFENGFEFEEFVTLFYGAQSGYKQAITFSYLGSDPCFNFRGKSSKRLKSIWINHGPSVFKPVLNFHSNENFRNFKMNFFKTKLQNFNNFRNNFNGQCETSCQPMFVAMNEIGYGEDEFGCRINNNSSAKHHWWLCMATIGYQFGTKANFSRQIISSYFQRYVQLKCESKNDEGGIQWQRFIGDRFLNLRIDKPEFHFFLPNYNQLVKIGDGNLLNVENVFRCVSKRDYSKTYAEYFAADPTTLVDYCSIESPMDGYLTWRSKGNNGQSGHWKRVVYVDDYGSTDFVIDCDFKHHLNFNSSLEIVWQNLGNCRTLTIGLYETRILEIKRNLYERERKFHGNNDKYCGEFQLRIRGGLNQQIFMDLLHFEVKLLHRKRRKTWMDRVKYHSEVQFMTIYMLVILLLLIEFWIWLIIF